MWPALMMFWAITTIIHHKSSCCKGLDHYYCLTQGVHGGAQISTGTSKPWMAPLKGVPKDWEFDLTGRYDHYQKIMTLLSEPGALGVEDKPDEYVNEALTGPLVGADTVERVDHYTQLLPESLINTDDEITFSAADTEDEMVGPWTDKEHSHKYFK